MMHKRTDMVQMVRCFVVVVVCFCFSHYPISCQEYLKQIRYS